jgi:hypothetical protein
MTQIARTPQGFNIQQEYEVAGFIGSQGLSYLIGKALDKASELVIPQDETETIKENLSPENRERFSNVQNIYETRQRQVPVNIINYDNNFNREYGNRDLTPQQFARLGETYREGWVRAIVAPYQNDLEFAEQARSILQQERVSSPPVSDQRIFLDSAISSLDRTIAETNEKIRQVEAQTREEIRQSQNSAQGENASSNETQIQNIQTLAQLSEASDASQNQLSSFANPQASKNQQASPLSQTQINYEEVATLVASQPGVDVTKLLDHDIRDAVLASVSQPQVQLSPANEERTV